MPGGPRTPGAGTARRSEVPGGPRAPGVWMWASFVLVATLVSSPALDAQQVTGRVLDASDAQPLGGAYVVLLSGGQAVASTVTRPDGFFRLVGPTAGAYLLRADQLGYGRVERTVELPPPGTAVEVELRAQPQALELEGLVAEAERQCEVPEAVAVQVAGLWEEVTEAFQVAALVEEQQSYGLRMERWERTLEPEALEVLRDDRRPMRGLQRGSPFRSLSAEELSEDGYIRPLADGGFDYFAPDARVLLSRAFQNDHCFGVTIDPPADGDDDWVGLRFEPRERRVPDVRGVLWIDGGSLEPRRLDYAYTELPLPVSHREVGGRVHFQRLPDGPWIVQEWRIRMPEVQAEQYFVFNSGEPRYRYLVTRLHETGGRVVAARPVGGEEVLLGETGTVGGVARRGGEVASGAWVALEGTVFRTRTGVDGRFRIPDVPPGRYRLIQTSPTLDSLGFEGGSQPVRVQAGEVVEVRTTVPDLPLLLAGACTEPLAPDAEGLLRGVVAGPEGGSASGPTETLVELSWPSGWDVASSGRVAVIREDRTEALIPVEDNGSWWACGVPTGVEVEVRARPVEGGGAGRVESVEARRDRVLPVRLAAPAEAVVADGASEAWEGVGDGAASGSADGADGVEAYLSEALEELGVRREVLGRRFAGPERLDELVDRAADALDMIRLLGMPGIRVVQLPEGLCVFSRRSQGMSLRGSPQDPVCAHVVVDGLPSDAPRLQSLPGPSVLALLYLRPAEAGARFGSGSEGGVLVVFTRRGGS